MFMMMMMMIRLNKLQRI